MAIDRQMAEIPTKTCTEYDFPSLCFPALCFPAFLITDRIVFLFFYQKIKVFLYLCIEKPKHRVSICVMPRSNTWSCVNSMVRPQ